MTTEIDTPALLPAFVAPDEGQMLQTLGLRLALDDATTGGAFTAGIVTNPGPGGPPLHTHHAMDEFMIVLRGRYRFQLGNTISSGGPGTTALFPRGISHSFASEGPGEGSLFFVTLPSSEAFLRGLAELYAAGVSPHDADEYFSRFDSRIDGPPLV
jgi:mannose-6-phosphate isomerase-like protein (cupin superfamily)